MALLFHHVVGEPSSHRLHRRFARGEDVGRNPLVTYATRVTLMPPDHSSRLISPSEVPAALMWR
jgi:hypothetical protein